MIPLCRTILFTCACALTFIANASRPFAQEPNPDMYLELVEVITAPSDDEWYSADGQISYKSKNGAEAIDYFWNSPPKIINASGFTLTLTIKGTSNYQHTIELRAGSNALSFEAEAVARLELLPGQTTSNSLTVGARPIFLAESMKGVVTDIMIVGGSGGVSYRYMIKNKNDDPGTRPNLTASIDDCPADIVISAPPLNCHITIAGFRHNTADEVEVVLPDAIDGFGNHANGIQVFISEGSMSVYNMTDPYQWGLFIFACPSQQNVGANCYGNMTAPGPVRVRILVRQKNTGEVIVPLTFTAVPHGGGVGVGGHVARIGNRFHDGNFINIETGPVVSGPIRAEWLSAQWMFEQVEGTEFVRLKSIWKPEIYLHTENGPLEAGTIQPVWQSAMWQIEPIAGTAYIRIRNRAHADQYLNTESGALQSSTIEPDWLSATWWLLP
jgi:hypothetical protein